MKNRFYKLKLISTLYMELNDYQSKLQSWRKITKDYDWDDDQIFLHNMRTQFYLNAKQNEKEFRERDLKFLINEVIKKSWEQTKDWREELLKTNEDIRQNSQIVNDEMLALKNQSNLLFDELKEQILDIKEQIRLLKETTLTTQDKYQELYKSEVSKNLRISRYNCAFNISIGTKYYSRFQNFQIVTVGFLNSCRYFQIELSKSEIA